jgi:putative tryptophan/tyrosine transport system substrate-binding protein
MRRWDFIVLLGSAVAWPIVGQAQQAKIYRVGVFSAGTARGASRVNPAFVKSLSELGWVEGKNILFEYRYAERLHAYPVSSDAGAKTAVKSEP